ncbi:ferritin [uncultured Fenollaria sp.]|uniref:ferritin n=1 Tax=uncultured Fenollaria sp. TaxID=1686315 RepID=UPI0025FF6956|nr:ferritin [uncultured Fenollaria sp.]
MKISKNVVDALVEQYNFELESGYIYLAMVHDLKDKAWDGFAHFMDKQAHEEYEHATKFNGFIEEIGEKVELKAMPEPKKEYKSVLEIFKTAYDHEQEVTKRIENIYELALKEKNYVVVEFLNWFLEEQVEEEDNMRTIVEVLENLKDGYTGLYLYDKELGRRE